MKGTTLLKTASIATAGAVCVALTLPGSANAASVTNPGFETGDFTGWATIGNTSVETAAFGTGPAEGSFQALLVSGSGSGPAANLVDLEGFLGLTPGSLNGLGNGGVTQGSAIKQAITAAAGDVLTFSWNFLTSESTPSSFNDFGFFSVVNGSADLTTLANTNSVFQLSPIPFFEETGYQSFSYTFASAGTYTLGFGVVDVGDTSFNSALLLDGFSSTPIPTPALLPGLIGMGVAAWRKRQGEVEVSEEA